MKPILSVMPSAEPAFLLRSALERVRLLEEEVSRLQRSLLQGDQAIRIFHHGSLIRISLSRILYFKAESNYTRIYVRDGQEYFVSRTLKSWLNEIRDAGFIRCHRSYLINPHEVVEFNRASGVIRLSSGAQVFTSRRFQRSGMGTLFPSGHPQPHGTAAKPVCAVHKLSSLKGSGTL